MDAEEFRIYGHKMIDFVADYYKNIESFPVMSSLKPNEFRHQFPENAPDESENFEIILNDVNKIVPGLMHWQHPSFFGYFPASSSFPSILGDLLSSAFSVQGMMWLTSPACTELETLVLDWVGKMSKLPDSFLSYNGKGGGVIQGTASESVLLCLVTARSRCLQKFINEEEKKNNSTKLIVYMSDQTHLSSKKACIIAGIPETNLRIIISDGLASPMNPIKLKEAIKKDISSGLIPCYVVSTLGTTATTEFDDLKAIGPICQEFGVWLHIDAAYAGSAFICPEFRPWLDGIEYADSYNFNAHKWLLTSFDCSLLWVKDRQILINTLSITPAYLKNKATDTGTVIDYRDWQIPLGRRFRSLKLWFVLRSYGVKRIQEHIKNGIRMAVEFENLVKGDARFELVTPRRMSLICFRVIAPNEINKVILENLNNSGKLYFTGAQLGDKYFMRIAIGNILTELKHVEDAWKNIAEEATKQLMKK